MKKTNGDQIILVAAGSKEFDLPVPLYFRTSLQAPLAAWREEAAEKCRNLLPHSRQAMRIFRDNVWRSLHACSHLTSSHLLRITGNDAKSEPKWMSRLSEWGVRELIHIERSPVSAPYFSGFSASISEAGMLRAKLSDMVAFLSFGSSKAMDMAHS